MLRSRLAVLLVGVAVLFSASADDQSDFRARVLSAIPFLGSNGVIQGPQGSAATASWPKLNPGTLLTTAEDGVVEIDADVFYLTTDAGNRGYVPARNFIRLDSTRTFANNTNVQAIFTTPTNGRLTLETGTYLFDGILNVSAMSATLGNMLFTPLGAGTATIGSVLYSVVGSDAAVGAAIAQSGSSMVTTSSPASAVLPVIATVATLNIHGTFEVTGAGTLIPSIQLVTAAAAVASVGSYLMFERIGSTSVVSVGQFD